MEGEPTPFFCFFSDKTTIKNTKEEYQMDSNKLLKIASVVTTVLGLGVSLVTSMLEEKKMDAMVSEKVAEAVKKAMEVK